MLQLLGESLPSLQADLKVLSSVESPDAALLQDLCQPDQLLIKHALQQHKSNKSQLHGSAATLDPTCFPLLGSSRFALRWKAQLRPIFRTSVGLISCSQTCPATAQGYQNLAASFLRNSACCMLLYACSIWVCSAGQRPDAALFQHLCQPDKLLINHALQQHKSNKSQLQHSKATMHATCFLMLAAFGLAVQGKAIYGLSSGPLSA